MMVAVYRLMVRIVVFRQYCVACAFRQFLSPCESTVVSVFIDVGDQTG